MCECVLLLNREEQGRMALVATFYKGGEYFKAPLGNMGCPSGTDYFIPNVLKFTVGKMLKN